ncbi:chemotaxis protein CheW [Methyloversatilis thermotolerans]|uniref:chemotaxis protein CheW n=1 Tax=Methyloversatilis thermotolerans TaxID=1346290 RepID=UPI00037BAEB2|nr:chemotaxis protein CheW [Methyloversatilis thermotolerans]
MARYKNIEVDGHLAQVIRYMDKVEEYREELKHLQSVWDNLTMLGQLSGTGNDMSSTRHAFGDLTQTLLRQLSEENLRKCRSELGAKAQVAIDILVRNLFERTADIGFLASDTAIVEFMHAHREMAGNAMRTRELSARRVELQRRFADYVAKYSVYADIVLFDCDGQIVARLDEHASVERTRDGVIAEALATDAAYVERFGVADYIASGLPALVYASRVSDGDDSSGVLALHFRFEDEMQRIFARLLDNEDWTVIVLLDDGGRVLASSDTIQMPIGARLDCRNDEARLVRFAGRLYLSSRRDAKPYQGYAGPGWSGVALVPVEQAFAVDDNAQSHAISGDLLGAVSSSSALFSAGLREIPQRADSIQRTLNRSVWNGNVRQSSSRRTLNASFSKVLLWEVSNTGEKTKDVFRRAITDLQETVVSGVLRDSAFLASLAVDILDRNLYERANDCRWWALTAAFRDALSDVSSTESRSKAASVLRYINSLYTVYSNLLLFDARGVVLADSQAGAYPQSSQPLGAEWVRRILALADGQSYAVSAFAPSDLYAGRPTYIFGAALHVPTTDGAMRRPAIGGIAIVFDGALQFDAMLSDCLPRDSEGQIKSGSFAAFVEPGGLIVACSDEARWRPGQQQPIAAEALAAASASDSAVIEIDGQFFAVGCARSSGYREYKGPEDAYRNEVAALVFQPLCPAATVGRFIPSEHQPVQPDRGGEGETLEIATFRIGRTWFGLRTGSIVEAVDALGTVAVPGAGPGMSGYLMYEDTPIALFDLAPLLNESVSTPPGERQALVMQAGEGTRLGILVDELGEIPEVSTSRLRPIPGMLGGGNVLGEAVLDTGNTDEHRLMLILGAERIFSRLCGGSPPPANAIPIARRDLPPVQARA